MVKDNEIVGLDIIDHKPDYTKSTEEEYKALADQYLKKYGEVPEWLENKLK